jgi:hypothetical protein
VHYHVANQLPVEMGRRQAATIKTRLKATPTQSQKSNERPCCISLSLRCWNKPFTGRAFRVLVAFASNVSHRAEGKVTGPRGRGHHSNVEVHRPMNHRPPCQHGKSHGSQETPFLMVTLDVNWTAERRLDRRRGVMFVQRVLRARPWSKMSRSGKAPKLDTPADEQDGRNLRTQ